MSSFLAGALMMTFVAPASICALALSASVKMPVDSRTMSTPRSPHGSVAGSFSLRTLISRPSMINASSVWSTLPGYAPYVESCLNSRAFMLVSTRSLTATTSTSGARSMSALSDCRPMRPKPLMPTRTAINVSSWSSIDLQVRGWCAAWCPPRAQALARVVTSERPGRHRSSPSRPVTNGYAPASETSGPSSAGTISTRRRGVFRAYRAT